MRLIFNAGAALAVTGLLTVGASFAGGPAHPAQAHPAQAQTARQQPSAAPDRAAAVAWLADGSVASTPHRHYSGVAEHFQAANTSQDGKLTLEQARQAGWTRVIRHFSDIDTAHAGFVTAEQIHAYGVANRHRRTPAGWQNKARGSAS